MAHTLVEFVSKHGTPYSQRLGIDIKKEPFKWFFASILFGARISEKIAINTYKQFEKSNILTPEKMIEAGWDELVALLDSGGYVRYDFKTADKLLEVCKNLQSYKNDLTYLHEQAEGYEDLCNRLKKLGKGVGDVTVNIFLRDMQAVWKKARPVPIGVTKIAMQKLGISDLSSYAKKIGVKVENLETALLVLAKDYCRKNRCAECDVKKLCKSFRK